MVRHRADDGAAVQKADAHRGAEGDQRHDSRRGMCIRAAGPV